MAVWPGARGAFLLDSTRCRARIRSTVSRRRHCRGCAPDCRFARPIGACCTRSRGALDIAIVALLMRCPTNSCATGGRQAQGRTGRERRRRAGVAASVRTVEMNHREFRIMGKPFEFGSATSIAVVAPSQAADVSLVLSIGGCAAVRSRRSLRPGIYHAACGRRMACELAASFRRHACRLEGPGKGFAVTDRYGVLACQRRHVFV